MIAKHAKMMINSNVEVDLDLVYTELISINVLKLDARMRITGLSQVENVFAKKVS